MSRSRGTTRAPAALSASPSASLRTPAKTRQPAASRRMAVARPMPVEAPVTRTDRIRSGYIDPGPTYPPRAMAQPDLNREQGGRRQRHLSGSILSVGASRGATLVAVALTSVAITRLLGPSGIGTYAISNALLVVFAIGFELGLPQALAYYAAREEWSGRSLARGAIGASFVLAVPGAAAALGGFALFGDSIPGMTWPMAIALTIALPFALLWRIV